MWRLPCFCLLISLHWRSGLRLWDIMLCSCPRACASSFTLMGLSRSCSIAASLVGFARLVKNLWQVFVSPFFICHPLLVV